MISEWSFTGENWVENVCFISWKLRLSSVVPAWEEDLQFLLFSYFDCCTEIVLSIGLSRSFVSDTAEFVELKFSTVLMATFSSMLQHVQRREPGAFLFLFLCLHSPKPCHCFEFCGSTSFLWLNFFFVLRQGKGTMLLSKGQCVVRKGFWNSEEGAVWCCAGTLGGGTLTWGGKHGTCSAQKFRACHCFWGLWEVKWVGKAGRWMCSNWWRICNAAGKTWCRH